MKIPYYIFYHLPRKEGLSLCFSKSVTLTERGIGYKRPWGEMHSSFGQDGRQFNYHEYLLRVITRTNSTSIILDTDATCIGYSYLEGGSKLVLTKYLEKPQGPNINILQNPATGWWNCCFNVILWIFGGRKSHISLPHRSNAWEMIKYLCPLAQFLTRNESMV